VRLQEAKARSVHFANKTATCAYQQLDCSRRQPAQVWPWPGAPTQRWPGRAPSGPTGSGAPCLQGESL